MGRSARPEGGGKARAAPAVRMRASERQRGGWERKLYFWLSPLGSSGGPTIASSLFCPARYSCRCVRFLAHIHRSLPSACSMAEDVSTTSTLSPLFAGPDELCFFFVSFIGRNRTDRSVTVRFCWDVPLPCIPNSMLFCLHFGTTWCCACRLRLSIQSRNACRILLTYSHAAVRHTVLESKKPGLMPC